MSVNDGTGCAPSNSPLARIVASAHEALQPTKVVAFGFNYDVSAEIAADEQVGLLLAERFLAHKDSVAAKLGAEPRDFGFKLSFPKDERTFNLNLESVEDRPSTLAVHLNTHYPRIVLPTSDDLHRMISVDYSALKDILEELLR